MNHNFSEQLFNSAFAMTLRQVKDVRPLTDSEKASLQKAVEKAGDMLPQMEHFREQIDLKDLK